MASDLLKTIMYSRMLVALAHGARFCDFDADKLDAISEVPATYLGDFWDFCLRIMGHPLRHVAMWVGRDTIYDADNGYPVSYQQGWKGAWVRGDISLADTTTYGPDTAEFAAVPSALTDDLIDKCMTRNGIGYCSGSNLVVSVGGMDNGTYAITTIYSPTGAGAAWAVDTDTITVVDGVGSITVVGGPCYVHLVVVEPGGANPPEETPTEYAPIVLYPRCEGVTNPQSVDTLTPELAWSFYDQNADGQYAYELLVASSEAALASDTGDMWDTGKTVSASEAITYAGSALSWSHTYYWKVRVWDDSSYQMRSAWASGQFTTEEGGTPPPPPTNTAPNVPGSPKCEGSTNPTDITTITPEFTWTHSDTDGDAQHAYRILVSSTEALLAADTGDLWNSGVVVSPTSAATYEGTTLEWGETYYWKVMVWDAGEGHLPSPYCAAQTFSTLAGGGGAATPGPAIREHFRLGAGRSLEWLGTSLVDSGLRATQIGDPSEAGTCLITSLSVQADAVPLVTRIYPQTADGLTLSLASKAAPDGYTISPTGEYVERDASVEDYGIIEQWRKFDDIVLAESASWVVHPEMAANALLDRSVEILRRYGQSNSYYELGVVCNEAIRVGEIIRVVYYGYSDDGQYIGIDEDLYVTAVTSMVDDAGLYVNALEVATVDAARMTEAAVLARAVQATRRRPRSQKF